MHPTPAHPARLMSRPSARGFSLLELMLVLVIIGVITAIAAVSITGGGARAKKSASYASMQVIKSAIDAYKLTNNVAPPTLAALQAGATPYLEATKQLQDGWKQDFIYSPTSTKGMAFELFSKGDDLTFGTSDDLSVWDKNQNN
ncbi:MAG: type II secretion system protein GspG [Phycisphaerales bacterium]